MGDGGDAVGGLAGDGDGDVRHLLLRGLGQFLEVLNHPVLLLHGIAASEEVTVFVIAGPFGACLLYTSGSAGDVPQGPVEVFGDVVGAEAGEHEPHQGLGIGGCLLYTSRCV